MSVFTKPLLALLPIIGGALHVAAGDPFFIMGNDLLISTRADPVVSPGQVSGHVHAVVGGNAFGKDYNFETSQTSTCTTADVTQDKSNYWTPQLYRKQQDGSFRIAPMKRANIYYFTRRQPGEKVYSFPEGFKVLVGSASRSTYNASSPLDRAISYACLGRDGDHTRDFPKVSCPGDLRAQVFFPTCWDGVNSWLEGSQHVAYPEGDPTQGGRCPSTHPKRIPGLSYEFSFHDDYPYAEGARVWASSDVTGYGLHADFTMGWPVSLLQQGIDDPACNTGDPGDCPPFKQFMDRDAARGCTYAGLRVDENIGDASSVPKLPGNNPLWGAGTPKVVEASYVEAATWTAFGPSVPEQWTKKGCVSDPAGGRALTGTSKTDDGMTPEMCTTFCKSGGFSHAGVEWGRGYCGHSLASGAKSVADTFCGNSCSSLVSSKGFCGGSRTITLYTDSSIKRRRPRR